MDVLGVVVVVLLRMFVIHSRSCCCCFLCCLVLVEILVLGWILKSLRTSVYVCVCLWILAEKWQMEK